MMLFLDTNNRLYIISLDMKRKATWIPLPSSSPGRQSAHGPKVPALKMAASASELKVPPQTTVNASRQMSTESEPSTISLAEDQLLACGVS